ncbi:MAG: methylmalonyl-CoA epimerase [Planctomycetes bacterium]|nr:methylmalonyl-CoA epimerase [Planctomycetota bacterium]
MDHFIKIDHIGIAVRDLDAAIETYRALTNIEDCHTEVVEEMKVKTAFFKIGDTNLELVCAVDESSPIHQFLEKNREGIHHMAFQTDDIRGDLKRLKDQGFKLINEEPMVGAHGKLIAFVHPKSTNGVLLELCQCEGSE